MDVFISWSGDKSKAVAETLRHYLPLMLQATQPFTSTSDIEAGTRGLDRVCEQLQKTKVGVFCLTAANREAPWIMFEAGAISKTPNSLVCNFLIDLENTDVKPPLGQYQNCNMNEEGVKKLMSSINSALKEFGLAPEMFNAVFNQFKPNLIADLEKCKAIKEATTAEKRSDESKTDEMLGLIRQLASRVDSLTQVVNQNRNDTPRSRSPILKYAEEAGYLDPRATYGTSLTSIGPSGNYGPPIPFAPGPTYGGPNGPTGPVNPHDR